MELNNINKLLCYIPNNVTIVAATKYVEANDMIKLLEFGINNFGENRVDSFLRKYDELKDENIVWHFIGHLQINKVNKVINKISYLHSLDSIKLAHEINKYRIEPLNCFIEININEEETKTGLAISELEELILEIKKLPNINIIGLMAMSVKASSEEEKLHQFINVRNLLKDINEKYEMDLKYLSMGMSDDYEAAIKAGSTHIRLGRILWTQKN